MSGSETPINAFNPVQLIEEVRKRPGLYDAEHPTDRLDRLQLWKEVGAALFSSWDTFNKATMYHTVLQIQRKWRSLRDAYNRELRARRSGIRIHRRVYIYFKKMSFLGGYEGELSEEEEERTIDDSTIADNDPLVNGRRISVTAKQPRRRRRRAKSSSASSGAPEELEMPVFNNVEVPADADSDTDKLFLLSFLPEMRQLPLHIKMWTRVQIANIMQEAVSCHYNNVQPGSSSVHKKGVKQQRRDSSD